MIAPDVVLTAAHCGGGKYKAVIGRDDIYAASTGDEVTKKVEKTHPSYDSKTTEYDMMLVFLSRATTANVGYVQVNSRSSVPAVGDSVVVMGWGDTIASDDMMELSQELRAVEVKTISNSVCEASSGRVNGVWDSYNNQIYDAMLCARDDNQDACQGDSGKLFTRKQFKNIKYAMQLVHSNSLNLLHVNPRWTAGHQGQGKRWF